MRKMTTYLILLTAYLMVGTSCEKETVEPAKLSNKIEKKVSSIAKDRNIPSLEYTITTEEGKVDFKYHHKEVTKQNIYGVGSTTKFLSAVLIFKLIEDNKLSLDAKVSDYVPFAKQITGAEDLTIKNLLNHSSGLHDYTKNPDWMKSVMENNAPKTFQEKVLLIADATENGGSFTYSNTNYLFLQEIVEAVTNKPFDVFFNEFYASNDLSGIQIGISEDALQSFFGQTAEGSSNVSAWREYYGYDGGAYADTKTLDSFLIKLNKDKSILKESTLKQMQEWTTMGAMTIPMGDGIVSEYGNGIMKLSYKGQEYIGHFGGTLKYQSMVLYNSEKNSTVSLVTNCSGRYFNNIFFQELIPAILDEL